MTRTPDRRPRCRRPIPGISRPSRHPARTRRSRAGAHPGRRRMPRSPATARRRRTARRPRNGARQYAPPYGGTAAARRAAAVRRRRRAARPSTPALWRPAAARRRRRMAPRRTTARRSRAPRHTAPRTGRLPVMPGRARAGAGAGPGRMVAAPAGQADRHPGARRSWPRRSRWPCSRAPSASTSGSSIGTRISNAPGAQTAIGKADGRLLGAWLVFACIIAGLSFFYDSIQHGLWGQTLGKRALGTRVVSAR